MPNKYAYLLCFMTTVFSHVTFANSDEALSVPSQIELAKTSAIRPKKEAQKTARVRIPLKLQAYSKVIVKDPKGVSRIEHKPMSAKVHTLRARVDIKNHFYVGDWHIETIPIAFDRNTMDYKVGLRFAKKYGDGWDLEEYTGRMELSGRLVGKTFLYDLIGSANDTFVDPKGQPILSVEAGLNPLDKNKEISKNDPPAVAKSGTNVTR